MHVAKAAAYSTDVERLWTPWRRAFIEGASGNGSDECFLCTKPAAHDDRANLILVRGEHAYALLNLYDDGSFEHEYVAYGWKAEAPKDKK